VSAQIIDALRKRADELVDRSTAAVWQGENQPEGAHLINRILAREFRKLADEAEGRERGGGHG
jgi:hypothetical protein